MEVSVNGEKRDITENSNVTQLVSEFSLNPGSLVVELNKKIVVHQEFDKTVLHAGDHVEIIRFVGGG